METRQHIVAEGIGGWTLRDAGKGLRVFLTAFLIVLSAGYAAGLLFVDHTTEGTPNGLVEQFRGSDETSASDEIRFAKSIDEMMTLIHNHLLSLSLVFFALGLVFYANSRIRGSLRTLLIVEPFVAIVTTFGGIFLMRYVWEGFNWLVIVSGISMAACFTVMVAVSLFDLWRRG